MTVDPTPLLSYWFGPGGAPPTLAEFRERTKFWFFKDPTNDRRIRELFAADVERASVGELTVLEATPRGRLALVLLLDQFPRNLYRGSARAFATDGEALRIVLEGLEGAVDRELAVPERFMFYMPLMHAEDRAMQERSVGLFRRLREEAPPELDEELANAVKFAERHREIIERFGRYPHRNAVVGRVSTPEEEAFLLEPGSSF